MRKPVSQAHESYFPEITQHGMDWLDELRSYIIDIRDVNVALSPVAISANTTTEQTFTVTDLKFGDSVISITKPSLTAGVGVLQARVSADNTLAIQYINVTTGSITPIQETYSIIYIRNRKI